MTVGTLIGADDIERAPIQELRETFTPEDRIYCRRDHHGRWRPLFSFWWDDVTHPVEWMADE